MMNFFAESINLNTYLTETEVIDYHHSAIEKISEEFN